MPVVIFIKCIDGTNCLEKIPRLLSNDVLIQCPLHSEPSKTYSKQMVHKWFDVCRKNIPGPVSGTARLAKLTKPDSPNKITWLYLTELKRICRISRLRLCWAGRFDQDVLTTICRLEPRVGKLLIPYFAVILEHCETHSFRWRFGPIVEHLVGGT